MPTMCSSCNRTSGKCESCIKVDAVIREHPSETFRAHMLKSLATVTPSPEPAAPPESKLKHSS